MATARYGGYLRASLPPFWATTDPVRVRQALERLDTANGRALSWGATMSTTSAAWADADEG